MSCIEDVSWSADCATLTRLLEGNVTLQTILGRAPQLELEHYYLAAGAISQTVWNIQLDRPAEADIADYDLVYHDPSDLSIAAEDQVIRRARALFADLCTDGRELALDVKNEARVHLWYPEHFGREIEPYASVERAIDTFPTTVTTVGVRRAIDGDLIIYASFGLGDLLNGIVRPNKRLVTRERYEQKSARWQRHWPHLRIMGWDADAADAANAAEG